MQRNVSTPLQLHELNLVNKSNTDLLQDKKAPAPPITPRKTQPPVNGPRLNIKTTVVSSKRHVSTDHEDKLYKLAQKKREIGELEERLAQLKKELKIMEQEFSLPSSQSPAMNNNSRPQMQQSQQLQSQQQQNKQQQPQGPNKFKENRFVQSFLTKFNEFNIGEDEFDDHIKSQNESDFYLKEGYDLGEDELEREAQEEMGFLQRFNKWQAQK